MQTCDWQGCSRPAETQKVVRCWRHSPMPGWAWFLIGISVGALVLAAPTYSDNDIPWGAIALIVAPWVLLSIIWLGWALYMGGRDAGRDLG